MKSKIYLFDYSMPDFVGDRVSEVIQEGTNEGMRICHSCGGFVHRCGTYSLGRYEYCEGCYDIKLKLSGADEEVAWRTQYELDINSPIMGIHTEEVFNGYEPDEKIGVTPFWYEGDYNVFK